MDEERKTTVAQVADIVGVGAAQVRNLARAAGVGQKIAARNSAILFTAEEVRVIVGWRKEHPPGKPKKRT